MNNVKNYFSIKDLENLSGIKAHTIRIWEKRYNLLAPDRTDSNIRLYDLKNLQKLLNITLLYNNGYKISKIANIEEDKIPIVVREIVSENSIKNHSINAFKLAMINFDQTMFFNTYNSLLTSKSFREIFHEVFIPLLNELGLLWQTDTISPSHEHFITSLIKQKILINTEKIQHLEPTNKNRIFVLYLPENEIHEIGLLYLNYEVVLHGYKAIFLGQTVPIDSLQDLLNYYGDLTFISYFTIEPNQSRIDNYLKEFSEKIGNQGNNELWILGQQTRRLSGYSLPEKIKIFPSIDSLISNL
ncbi:MerR family transcriptional regulator [Spongiivirga citrea]|uniref:MerR family transcriptional regulator n=1 Tax=Spongiivirga citrea TaxID=1481457 RepID=A0A6M0CIR5_9FLAO|nr:MerR family transcriptional regulator [Spongiivirga citrea]NER15839.1 MerR family transcriptional regulator [Spongiivirga citrea]